MRKWKAKGEQPTMRYLFFVSYYATVYLVFLYLNCNNVYYISCRCTSAFFLSEQHRSEPLLFDLLYICSTESVIKHNNSRFWKDYESSSFYGVALVCSCRFLEKT